MARKRFPYLLGHAEIAFLYGVERQTSQLWRTREVLPEPDFVVSGNPCWFLPTVLGLAETGIREVIRNAWTSSRRSGGAGSSSMTWITCRRSWR